MTSQKKNQIYISKRLMRVAELVGRADCLADIGTDHGYLPIYLIQYGIVKRCIAMDLRDEPLRRAKNHMIEAGVLDRVDMRISDGFEKLKKGEADVVTITGMGGRLMSDILLAGKDHMELGTHLVLSPQSDYTYFRNFLFHNGFAVKKEHIIREAEKTYFIYDVTYEGLVYGRSQLAKKYLGYVNDYISLLDKEETGHEEIDAEKISYEILCMFGANLLEENNVYVKKILLREIEKTDKVIKQLAMIKDTSLDIELRKRQMDERMICLMISKNIMEVEQ